MWRVHVADKLAMRVSETAYVIVLLSRPHLPSAMRNGLASLFFLA